MEDKRACKFYKDIYVYNIYEHQLEEDSILYDQAGILVRRNWNSPAFILINIDKALRDCEDFELNTTEYTVIDDYITFIEAHEIVHYFVHYFKGSPEEEYKADLFGTALCSIKGYQKATAIGLQRLEERYDTDEPIAELLREAISNLNE